MSLGWEYGPGGWEWEPGGGNESLGVGMRAWGMGAWEEISGAILERVVEMSLWYLW